MQARSVSIQLFFGWVAWGFKSGVCVVSDFSIRGDGLSGVEDLLYQVGKALFFPIQQYFHHSQLGAYGGREGGGVGKMNPGSEESFLGWIMS